MKKFLTLFLVLTLIVSFTACSKKAEETDTDPNNDVEVEENDDGQDVEEEKEEEEEGWNPSGHVTIGTPNFNGFFINGWGNNAYDNNIRQLVFGGASTEAAGLMTSTEGGEIVENSIVESREKSDDEIVHTFKLKPDLVYSDGSPLTADDVIFTYNFYMDTEALTAAGGTSSLQEYVDKIEKIDDLTIKFTLKAKYYASDSLVFIQNILCEEWATKDKPADKTIQQHVKDSIISNPIGYGPYKIVEYKEGLYVKLTVNENYIGNYEGIKPEIKDIIAKVVSDETQLDELLTGSIDILPGVVEAEQIEAVKADDNFDYCNYPRQGFGHLTFHSDFGPVRHKEVRQAIAYTIDRVVFREAFLGKYSISTDGPYTTNYWMIDEEWVDKNLTKYTSDKEKVNEILSEAGWAIGSDGIWAKDGEKLEIKIAAGSQRWADSLNLTIGKAGKEFGIKFDVAFVDFAILLDHYYGQGLAKKDRKYHMYGLATTLNIVYDGYDNWHSDKIVEPWGSGTGTNSARFSNDKCDELLLTMRMAESDEVYKNAYREWVKLMNDEMPVLPLYSNDYHDLYNKRLKGFQTNAIWGWVPAILKSTLK
jgi:peptide/nickel transport system substrate-binding protein